MSPIGDQGGSCSQLIITCTAVRDIKKNDPIVLVENYLVTNVDGELFGQAMADCNEGENFPVLVRGIARFHISFVYDKWGRWMVNKVGELAPSERGVRLTILYRAGERMDVLL